MAKTKTKKEEIIDLKPKAEKITDEQLKRVQDAVNNINRFQLELGMLETRKHAVLDHVVTFQGELAKMQNELKKEYGTDNINIHTGEINHDEQAD